MRWHLEKNWISESAKENAIGASLKPVDDDIMVAVSISVVWIKHTGYNVLNIDHWSAVKNCKNNTITKVNDSKILAVYSLLVLALFLQPVQIKQTT